MNWILGLSQVSDFIVIFYLRLWTKGGEMSLSYRELHAQECWGTGSHFFVTELKSFPSYGNQGCILSPSYSF